jgi:hydroxyacylglutathione hydrolase
MAEATGKAQTEKTAGDKAAGDKAAGDKAADDQAKKAPARKGGRFTKATPPAAEVARRYFDAVAEADLDTMVSCWAPGGIDNIAPIGELRAPDEIRAFFSGLFQSTPDMKFEVLDFIPEESKVAVRWRATGTFSGGPFMGIEPTGARVQFEGIDMVTVEDGLIRRNDAYYDGTQFARQIGMLPARDSNTERRMTSAFNARTRFSRRFGWPSTERVADRVWLVRGGFPMKTMNVYLIEDDDGVTIFDAGIRAMTKGIATAAAQMGGIRRVLLGHSHADHRGAASRLAAPVICHVDEVSDAEGDGGAHYFDFSKLERRSARVLMPRFLKSWDGGPVKIEDTVTEGDAIAGFEVIHLPGHAPGMIGLWRKQDGLALVSDTLYTLDPQTGRRGGPRVPHPAFNQDTEQARASIRKLAALEPAAVWPGHADPVRENVRSELERAADTT